MNTKIKLALGLIAGGSLLFLGLRRKNRKAKTFTAPDGNTYLENQIYRTVDNQLYKNGKPFHFNKPKPETTASKANSYVNSTKGNLTMYQHLTKDVQFHQKGVRHH